MKKISLTTLALGIGLLQAQSFEQGQEHIYYERYNSAEAAFHQVLTQDANNAEAWYGLTEAYLLQDEANSAFDSLQKAPDQVKDEPYFKVAQGAALLHLGKKGEAMAFFGQALEQTKEKDEDILGAIAQAHINAKAGDANYAIEQLNKAIKRAKKDADYYILLGDAYRKQSNGTEAFKAYQKAIQENEKLAAAYHKTGEIFLTQKNAEMYVDYFQKALAADPNYSPSLYKLYAYEFYHNPAKAMEHYQTYMAKSDPSIQHQYDLTDLLYINKQYDEAIQKATKIFSETTDAQPRLYKLIGYSYAAKKDTAKAIPYMQQYFEKEQDSNLIAKDFISMAAFFASQDGQDSLAMVYLEKGVAIEKDSTELIAYYKKLADLSKDRKDYAAQAKWLGKYYSANDKASNIDLFNWGLAHYLSEDYVMADSVFGMYASKYPEQGFGFYWQAKSKALQDKDMQQGLAIPVYQQLIEVLQKDSTEANYKKWMVEAYGYLAAYQANTKKDYAQAINYFEKLLEVDPENGDAKKYIAVLEKNIDKTIADNSSKANSK